MGYDDLKINEEMLERHKREITSKIEQANNLGTKEYKDKVRGKGNKSRKKRKIKNGCKSPKNKRYGATVLILLLLAGGYVTFNKERFEEYKDEAAARVLTVVKDELGATSLRNYSTRTSSISGIEHYEVVKDGKTYTHKSDILEGKTSRIVEDELPPEVIEAIKIVSEAQNGSIFDAMMANRYADKIEQAKIDLKIDPNVKTSDIER